MSDMKKVLLYAIIPAIIAGLFALIPKIYDEMNEPKANLEYSIFQGPLLKAGEQYKTIVSIEVENTGKKVLSNVVAIVESYADIESESLTSSMGFEPKLTIVDSVKVSAGKMHPNDKFSLSLMLSSQTNILPPKIALRADEVVGTIKSSKKDNSKNVSFFSSLLSGMSVFVMSAYFIVKSRFGTTLPSILSKHDNLFYIAAKVGSKDLVDAISEQGGSLTYLRFSDIIFYLGESGELKKQDAINGLECLLLVDEIAASSRKHIERNLTVLSDAEINAEHLANLRQKSKSIKNSFELRNSIDEHLNLAEVF
ncbi:hypothetical protein [Vibrio tarriae]|uniref:hypothetical protein n=1 Tax=Vibrio tarriae TaxID=2014742 RepID=UPI000DE21DD6|nr:hypothetical protein [Vibrio tarriae]ELH5920451.1 hypothetical protein [Vibrio cholerae]ELQ3752098.1 hypothetical protein [Vibrio cholerae]RBM24994.1 hypothetical protein DLR61_18490 [Vibrio tarriae]